MLTRVLLSSIDFVISLCTSVLVVLSTFKYRVSKTVMHLAALGVLLNFLIMILFKVTTMSTVSLSLMRERSVVLHTPSYQHIHLVMGIHLALNFLPMSNITSYYAIIPQTYILLSTPSGVRRDGGDHRGLLSPVRS